MTQKRKAELQRKLSMAPVAKPPSDLADRIKADIPAYLDAEREREELSRSTGFTLRVAASIVLLVGSVFLAVQLLSRDEAARVDVMADNRVPAALSASVPEDSTAVVPPSRESIAAPQSSPDIFSETPARLRTAIPVVEEKVTGDLARAKEAPEARGRAVAAQTEADTESSAFLTYAEAAPPPAAPLPAAAPPPPPALVRAEPEAQVGTTAMRDAVSKDETAVRTDSQRRLQRGRDPEAAAEPMVQKVAATYASASTQNVAFGISTDPAAFKRVSTILERGEKPSAGAVDVPALINHFAGSPERWPREVNLNVESSLAPLPAGGKAMIRFTIDSAIGVQVRLNVDVNERGLRSHRFVSGERLAQQVDERLTPRQSVTGVIEVEPMERLSAAHRIATFTLQYLSPTGKPELITRVVQARDIRAPWSSATRRHRLATLGASFGESLRGTRPSTDIAAKATQLASEQPDDERANELAKAAANLETP